MPSSAFLFTQSWPPLLRNRSGQVLRPRAQGAVADSDLLSSLLLSCYAALTLGEAAVRPEATHPRMCTEPYFGLPACVILGCNLGVWPMYPVAGKDVETEGGEVIALSSMSWSGSAPQSEFSSAQSVDFLSYVQNLLEGHRLLSRLSW